MEGRLSSRLVSAVVVTRGDRGLLLPCLQSVARQTHRPLECFVFFNPSQHSPGLSPREGSPLVFPAQEKAPDFSPGSFTAPFCESTADLPSLFPSFLFRVLPRNELYCVPHNEGIRLSKGEFVLCLNDDVVLEPDFIAEALKAFDGDPRIGSVNGRLLRPDGRTIDSLGFSWSRCRKPLEPRQGQPWREEADAQGRYVFGANGAAAFYRRRMLEAVKLDGEYFDEDYGIYYEDYDLAWRASNAGWKAYYCPQARAVHCRGASTRLGASSRSLLARFALANLPVDLKVRLIRNRYATMVKNDSPGRFVRDSLFILFYDLRLWSYLLVFDRISFRRFFSDRRFWRRAWAKRRRLAPIGRPDAR